jgi:hypothetical protein
VCSSPSPRRRASCELAPAVRRRARSRTRLTRPVLAWRAVVPLALSLGETPTELLTLWFTVSALFITLALCDNQARKRRPAARPHSQPQSKRPLAPLHAAVAGTEADAATAGARASSAPAPRRRPNREEKGDDASDSSGDAETAAPRRGADLEALRRELEQEQRRESSGHETRPTSFRDVDSSSDRGSERSRARQDGSHLASASNGPQPLPAWAPKGRRARARARVR